MNLAQHKKDQRWSEIVLIAMIAAAEMIAVSVIAIEIVTEVANVTVITITKVITVKPSAAEPYLLMLSF